MDCQHAPYFLSVWPTRQPFWHKVWSGQGTGGVSSLPASTSPGSESRRAEEQGSMAGLVEE